MERFQVNLIIFQFITIPRIIDVYNRLHESMEYISAIVVQPNQMSEQRWFVVISLHVVDP